MFLYVGRIAVEKNIKAFLDLDLPGRKVLVGSGPQAADLARRYPDALFAGPMEGEELPLAYASADVFVFASLTDTFGLVLLEALASGVPVAAFPASGPMDVLIEPDVGAIDWDLQAASLAALTLRSPRRHGRMHFVTAGRIRRGSSSTTCSSRTTASCLSGGGAGAAIGKRKRPGWGETGPLHSHASVWGTLGGSRVCPEMVSDPLNFNNPAAKSGVQKAKSRKDFAKKFSSKRLNSGLPGAFSGTVAKLARLR